MKKEVDLTHIITDENDKPMYAWKTYVLADKETKQPIKEGDNYLIHTFEDKLDILTLGRFLRQCLMIDWEGITEIDKLEKFSLILELHKKEIFTFELKHIELIKKSISKQPTWVFGLIYSLLNIK